MTKAQSSKKLSTSAPGAKALITAASLAITLGGWAAFTRANRDTIDTASPAPAIAITLPRPSTDLKLAPQLLPTIVPAPPPPPDLAIAHPPVIPAALLSDSAPVAAPPAAQQPRAAAPAAAQSDSPATCRQRATATSGQRATAASRSNTIIEVRHINATT